MSKITRMKFFKIFLLFLSYGFMYSEPVSACTSVTNIPIGTTDYQIKAYGSATSCVVYTFVSQHTYTTPTTTGNQTSDVAYDYKTPYTPYVLETMLWFIPSYSQGTGIRCFATDWSNTFYIWEYDFITEDHHMNELCYLPFQ